ncbi:MAG: class A beta-lactamase-related serine hydrolase [Flavobacteriales bacterium]|nr:class A beta-lactamase-related serine hydrolase [Flavobacteriales bacterium]
MRNYVVPAVIGLSALAIGFCVGRFTCDEHGMRKPLASIRSEVSETRVKGNFHFINPLLECDQSTPVLRANVKELEKELVSFINNSTATADIEHVSLYYRDLNNGPWIGIGTNKPFSPASLLKVPVMIAALKQAERDLALLNRSFKFDSSVPVDMVDPNILDEQIKFGGSYTFKSLIERMIINSDNNAKNMIVHILGDDAIFGVWNDLGVPVPTDRTPEDFLTVRDYSSFFRVLFNATYLSREMSEMGLEILSRTKFDSGLSAGIPNEVQMSNKFGERGFADSNVKQLHDCGIVYSGKSPYLICVMTRGTDWQKQADLIAEISRMVYQAHTDVK